MKQRLADYIADFFVSHGITDVFTVVGGGAMHLNDAFGHHPKLRCTYNHHEQACAIAAEAYWRIDNRIAAVCVTSGPGGTNAITGVAGGWLDSIPMIIISGQVRYANTARWSGLNIRAMGNQEFDITKAVSCMTKYAEMVIDPEKIKYCLEKAFFLALSGRPGPIWLDIPLDVQAALIETEDLSGFDPAEDAHELPLEAACEVIDNIIEKIKQAKRPVINAGSAIRYSGGFPVFRELIERLNVPVVTGWNCIDLIPDTHPLYVGRTGIIGNRAGNFAVQNSDLILSLGSRLAIHQVGYNYQAWAREAYTIVVDIDAEELKKPTVHVNLPVCADVKDVMFKVLARLGTDKLFTGNDWIQRCQQWKQKYPVVQQRHYDDKNLTNVYAFVKELSESLSANYHIVVGVGSARMVSNQAWVIKNDSRYITNSGLLSMGYDLPAAIGVCIADKKAEIICMVGDGGIQMNLQELQTIKTNKLPIKIFVINNRGYHSIRQTQLSFFGEPLVGIGPDSGDLECPDMGRIAYAYGFPYKRCLSNAELGDFIRSVFAEEGAIIAEVFVSTSQGLEPKVSSRKLEDGTMVSSPLEDMSPFLSREELAENMFTPPP